MVSVLSQQLFTDVDVARYCGVAPVTLRRWRLEGRGPRFVRLGRSVKYRLEDVEAWLKSREEVPHGR